MRVLNVRRNQRLRVRQEYWSKNKGGLNEKNDTFGEERDLHAQNCYGKLVNRDKGTVIKKIVTNAVCV